MEEEGAEVQVPWELTLLVTWPSPLSDVLTLNITSGALGLSPPPPTPFLVAAISCFFRKVAAEFRFDPKEVAACWPLMLLSQLLFVITQLLVCIAPEFSVMGNIVRTVLELLCSHTGIVV